MRGIQRAKGRIRHGLILALSAILATAGLVPANAVAPLGNSTFLKQIQTQNLSGITGATSSSYNASSISLNGLTYFIGAPPTTGPELYVTDGTPQGTTLVKDAVPGVNGNVSNLTLANGKIFFQSGDSTSFGNIEPWVSDGTAAGTFRLKDIAPGTSGSAAYSFAEGPNGITYFLADDASTSISAGGTTVYNAAAIWATDGTEVGTYKVKDINTYSYGPSGGSYYPAQSSISGFTSCAGKVFFSGNDDNFNSWNELWVTDGTYAGTQEVKDINLTVQSLSLGMYSSTLNSTIAAGSSATGPSNPQNFVCLNNTLYFSADDGYGRTLWRSDGTAAGTYMVRPPADLSWPEGPTNITVFGNKLIMRAGVIAYGPNNNENLGAELWVSDGTSAGTQMIKDIWPLSGASSSPSNFTLFNGQLFFTATDSRGSELWKTDGTTVGTLFVKDINTTASGASGAPRYLYVWNNKLFFTANDGVNGEELWVSGGTGVTTTLVKDVFPGVSDILDVSNNSNNRPHFSATTNRLVFVANSPIYGQEMWATDGTESGTQLLLDLHTAPGSANTHDAIAFNGKIYFSAASAEFGQEIWSTDLTTGNTTQLADIWPGASSGLDTNASYFTVYNGRLYFSARSPTSSWELWSTDGTPQGTSLVVDLNVSTMSGSSNGPTHLAVCAGKLFFNHYGTGTYGTLSTLFSYNGTTATQVYNRTLSAKYSTCFNNVLYFNGQDYLNNTRDYEIWKSDGTLAGTSRLADIYPGTIGSTTTGNSSNPNNLVVYNNALYFTATNNTSGSATGTELYKTDGTTVTLIDINPGASGSGPAYLRVYNGLLWFSALSPVYGRELASYDGTNVTFTDFAAGSASSSFTVNMVEAGDLLWFAGASAATGNELFSSDTTAANTGVFEDLTPGAISTTISRLTAVGGVLIYNTYDTVMGSQPRFVVVSSVSTISFNSNQSTAGTVPADISVMSVSATVPGNTGAMTKTGFEFIGWNTNALGTGVSYLPGDTITPVVDTPLYARWASTTAYTIAYNANGATSGTVAPAVTGATTIFDLDNNSGVLARTGFTFGGWNTLANGAGTNYAGGARYTPTANVTLYAKWNALAAYTITFNANGASGATASTINTYATAIVTLPGQGSLVAPAGTSFAGWNTSAQGAGNAFAAAETFSPQASMTLFAQWTNVNQSTLTYDANGATSGSVPNALVAAGTYVVIDSNTGTLRKTGFIFSGWNTAADGSGTTYQGTDNYLLNSNVTLYAYWVTANYTVTFAGNQNTGGAVPAAVTGISVSTTLPGNTGSLLRAGYTFAGWNTLASGLGVDYAAGASYSPTASVTLFAKWTALPTYTIGYNGNSATGGGVPVAQTGIYSSVNLDNNSGVLSRSGYYFAGWNTQADGLGTTYLAGASYTPTANVTMYALWSNVATYSLSYNTNSSTSGTAPLVQSGITSTATVSANSGTLSRLGYRFDGWNTLANGLGITYVAGATITLTADTTLYALWTSVPTYTITFAGNGQTSGSIPSSITSSNASVALPANTGVLNKTNNTFNGWNTQADGLGTHYDVGAAFALSANVTLYAEWLGNIYTLTYNSNGATSGSVPSPSSGRGAITTATNSGGLTKSGFTFGGWNTSGDGSGTTVTAGAAYTPEANTTLFAYWVVQQSYTVTFNANGASAGAAPSAITGILSSTTLPGNTGSMTLSARAFAGWNTLANGNGTTYAAGASYTPGANVTLFALWLVNYQISYDGNGATSGSVPTTQTNLSGNATVSGNSGNLARSAFNFGGWNTQANGLGTTYAAGAPITSNSDVVLFAVWTAAPTYTVSYDDNGATSGTAAMSAAGISSSITLDNNSGALTKTGFVFAGWNTQANGLGTTYPAGASLTPTANLTLYALWSTVAPASSAPKFTITKIAKRQFNLSGGEQTIYGNNLDVVTYIALDGQVLKIIKISDSSLTFAITEHAAGWATLTMKGDGAVLTFNKFVQFVETKSLTFTNFFNNSTAKVSETQIAKLVVEIVRARDFKTVQLGFAELSSAAVSKRVISVADNMKLVRLAMGLMKLLPKTIDVTLRLTGNSKDLTLSFNNN